MSKKIVPNATAPARLNGLIPESASCYFAHGRLVAVVFPGENHSDAWEAAQTAARSANSPAPR
jgi:hypothetical protein